MAIAILSPRGHDIAFGDTIDYDPVPNISMGPDEEAVFTLLYFKGPQDIGVIGVQTYSMLATYRFVDIEDKVIFLTELGVRYGVRYGYQFKKQAWLEECRRIRRSELLEISLILGKTPEE